MKEQTDPIYDDEFQPWNAFEVAEILRELTAEDAPGTFVVVRHQNSAPEIHLSLPIPADNFVAWSIAFGLGKAGWDEDGNEVRGGRQRFTIRPRHLLTDKSSYETSSAA